MMTASNRDRYLDAIAEVIAAAAAYDDPAEYAATVNDGDGWTIDVGLGHEGPGNWTRTEGIRLSADDLAEAIIRAYRRVYTE